LFLNVSVPRLIATSCTARILLPDHRAIQRGGDAALDRARDAQRRGGARHLINKGDRDAVFLEVGSRRDEDGDVVEYPDVDLRLLPTGFTRKDGTPY
jgi:uncharacterized cupin superfamily protein